MASAMPTVASVYHNGTRITNWSGNMVSMEEFFSKFSHSGLGILTRAPVGCLLLFIAVQCFSVFCLARAGWQRRTYIGFNDGLLLASLSSQVLYVVFALPMVQRDEFILPAEGGERATIPHSLKHTIPAQMLYLLSVALLRISALLPLFHLTTTSRYSILRRFHCSVPDTLLWTLLFLAVELNLGQSIMVLRECQAGEDFCPGLGGGVRLCIAADVTTWYYDMYAIGEVATGMMLSAMVYRVLGQSAKDKKSGRWLKVATALWFLSSLMIVPRISRVKTLLNGDALGPDTIQILASSMFELGWGTLASTVAFCFVHVGTAQSVEAGRQEPKSPERKTEKARDYVVD